MIVYGTIILIIYLALVTLDILSSYSKNKCIEMIEKELNELEKQKIWEYYIARGFVWFIDLNIIGFLIYAITQI